MKRLWLGLFVAYLMAGLLFGPPLSQERDASGALVASWSRDTPLLTTVQASAYLALMTIAIARFAYWAIVRPKKAPRHTLQRTLLLLGAAVIWVPLAIMVIQAL